MIPNDNVGEAWLEYAEKLKRLAELVKLTAFWTREAARACYEAAEQTEEAARNVRAYLNKPKFKELVEG